MATHRDVLVRYALAQNIENGYQVSPEDIESIADIMDYVGGDLYRPLTRLLLANWNEIRERVDAYTEEQWALAEKVAHRMEREMNSLGHEKEVHIDKCRVAMFFEMLEGDDTIAQSPNGDKPMDINEIIRIRAQEAAEYEAQMMNQEPKSVT